MHRNRTKMVAIFLSMIFLLTACSSADKSTAENIQGSDPADGEYQSDFQNGLVAGSPEGYYFFHLSDIDYMYFFDRNTKQVVPLCGKADCSHDSSDCDAYFPAEIFRTRDIKYSGGYLYMLGLSEANADEWALYRISRDGSSREKVMKLCTAASWDSQYLASDIPCFMLQDGYIYYSHSDTDNAPEFTATMYRAPLKGNMEPEILWEGNGYNNSIRYIKAIGNKVYFEVSAYEDADYTKKCWELFCYDRETGKTESVLDGKDVGAILENRTIVYGDGSGTVVYDMDTGEETRVLDTFCAPIHFDGTYLYFDEWAGLFEFDDVEGDEDDEDDEDEKTSVFDNRTIYVYDLDYNLVDKIVVPGRGSVFYGGDCDYLFADFVDSDEDIDELRALDKSQIGTGKHEWITISVK